ncbi:glycosyltransferase family 4 protein [Streptomyces sp. NPDC056500]|uniref:glycosyltransferase family 4 protein n=1 Tax=Streptomyces sp. NPDC056500 TaxID=3345840 RepID=UPI0036CF4B58
MKISLLIHTIYGIGGTIRTTLNLAEELASRHEVEIVSVFRHRDIPLFDIDPRITVVPLVDTRPSSPGNEKKHPDQLKPAKLFPPHEARYKEYSELTDERVRAHYAGSDADVVIGTRPGLVAYAAQFAPVSTVVIGQEHMTYHHHKEALREEMRPLLAETDAFVTVSEGDAAVWREQMPLPDTRILSIPNSVPDPDVSPSDTTGNIIVAAGRLSREKQYDVLLKAFADVVALRPDWTLRIYGWGPERERLRRRVQKLRLYNSVQLMGPRSPIEPEWVKGAIAVSTSRHESFGMTLVEAMRCGLPVVSTDCDYGPREIIKDGVDGLLVPVGDVAAVSAALLRLIDDRQLRRRMGAEARENSRRYDPAAIAKQYTDLFAELGAGATQHNRGAPVAESARSAVFAPVADAVAQPDGSVTVRLITPEAAVLKHPGLQLLCTKVGDGAPSRAYPFDLDGSVTIPAADDFADGHWTCHADQPATGLRAEIFARTVDQRGSLKVADRLTTGAPVHHHVPYRRAPEQHLVLRSWVRPVHAEAADFLLSDRRLTLTGRLVGDAEPSGEPSLLLRRGGDSPEELSFPGTREGTRGFEVTIGCEVAVAHQHNPREAWEVWLRYAPGEEPVRVGRVLDDVVQKGDVFVYPEALFHKQRPLLLARRVLRRLRHQQQRLVKVKLAYDRDNALVLHVSDR